MPRSLLDAADLGAVRAAAAARPGAEGALTACLLEGGVFTPAADDPGGVGGDRIVCGCERMKRAIDGAAAAALLALEGDRVLEGGRALAVAAGIAAASTLDGSVSKVFCLLGQEALDDGVLWEAALSARDSALVALVVVDGGQQAVAQSLFAAAGWRVASAAGSDPLEVLAALDRVLRQDQSGPGAVLAGER